MKIRCFPAAAIAAVSFAGWLQFAAPAIAQESATPQAAASAAPAVSPPLPLFSGGEDILKLSRSTVSEEVTIAFIQNGNRRYTPTAAEIIYLRKEGVSDRVLTAMLNHEPGAAAAPAVAPTADASASAPPYTGPLARTVVGEASPATTVYVAGSVPAYYYAPWYYDPWPFWYDPWPYSYPYFSIGFSWGWGWAGCYSGYYGYYGYYGHHGHNGHHHPPPPHGGGQPHNGSPSTVPRSGQPLKGNPSAVARSGQSPNGNRSTVARGGQPNTVARGGQAGGATSSVGRGANNRTIASPSPGQVGSQSSRTANVSRGTTAVSAGRVPSYGGTMNSSGFRGGGSYGATSVPRMSGGGGFQGGASAPRMSAGGGFRGGGGGGSRR